MQGRLRFDKAEGATASIRWKAFRTKGMCVTLQFLFGTADHPQGPIAED